MCLPNTRFILGLKDSDCKQGSKCNRLHATKNKPFKQKDIEKSIESLADKPLEVKKFKAALKAATEAKNPLIAPS